MIATINAKCAQYNITSKKPDSVCIFLKFKTADANEIKNDQSLIMFYGRFSECSQLTYLIALMMFSLSEG